MTDMHGQNGRRLLAQPLATRFHEVSHCAGFLLCKAHRTVATADKVIVLYALCLVDYVFQKCCANVVIHIKKD
ncbi:hypothetical protein FYK18_24350 [Escherichia albertii]|nr:hypothetical protein FYK18_24350 [Escherichia albertii]